MKVVIGDIHGCFYELLDLWSKIGINNDDEIISIGDMVDRGPASDKVVGIFRTIGKAILGNHERKHVRHFSGLMADRNFGRAQRLSVEQFKKANMDYEEVIGYFAGLPNYLDLSEAILVHAGLIYGVPLDFQNEKILTGAGFQKENEIGDLGVPHWCESYPKDAKPVIFGHLSLGGVPRPYNGNLWHLDTGCVRGGFLTAITLPDLKI